MYMGALLHRIFVLMFTLLQTICQESWWRHQMETFSALLAICVGNSPVNSPHKGQWRGALTFSYICVWITCWVNSHEAGDLRCYCARNSFWIINLSNHCTFAKELPNDVSIMTSSNETIFRVTGPLCGELTQSFDVFFALCLNKRLSKQPWGWWFETPPWSLWLQYNAFIWFHLTECLHPHTINWIP